MKSQSDNYMTLDEVALALGVDKAEARRLCEQKLLPSIRVPAIRVPRAAFDAYVKKWGTKL